ncbi:MAG: hypothetical protein SPH19_02735, partial [Sodaliphilus sp.]|nr:hypothetical protein [Sodaliphilus sp.]
MSKKNRDLCEQKAAEEAHIKRAAGDGASSPCIWVMLYAQARKPQAMEQMIFRLPTWVLTNVLVKSFLSAWDW